MDIALKALSAAERARDRLAGGEGSPELDKQVQELWESLKAEGRAAQGAAAEMQRDRKLLEFFEQEGIRPGTGLSVQARNYDDTITLSIGSDTVRLGLPAAARVWVGKG